jgi:AraC-like DNA-binding protein
MVFCYLDPGSAREQAVRARMTKGDHLVGSGHVAEAELVEAAGRLRDDSVGHWLDLAGAVAKYPADGRILAAMQRLREQTNPPFSADALAAEAGLSPSRFLHLFRNETGTSFRRYRMWARMLRAATLYLERRDLTSAAVDAGFASPSHFTDTFHDMFGLAPTQLLTVGADIRILDPCGSLSGVVTS